jgi:hypothetical protein
MQKVLVKFASVPIKDRKYALQLCIVGDSGSCEGELCCIESTVGAEYIGE